MSFVPLGWKGGPGITIEEWQKGAKCRLIHIDVEKLIGEIVDGWIDGMDR